MTSINQQNGKSTIPDRDALQRKIDGIADPVQREMVQSRIDQRYHTEVQNQRARRQKIWGEALQTVQSGTLPDHLPLTTREELGPDSVSRLRRVAAAHGRQATTHDGYRLANRLFNLPDQDLVDLDITENIDRLDVNDISHLQARQEMAGKRLAGEMNLYDPMNHRVRKQMKQVFRDTGLSGTRNSAERGRLNLLISRKLAEFTADGSSLTPEEESTAIAEALAETGGRPVHDRSPHYLGRNDISADTWDRISDRFALRRGRYPTEKEVLDIYLMQQAEGKAKP